MLLANELASEIQKSIPDVRIVRDRKWDTGYLGEVLIDSGYTNGQGLTELKYVVDVGRDGPVCLGVQLQGKSLRLFVESKRYAREMAVDLAEEDLWIHLPRINAGQATYSQRNGK